MNRAWGNTPDGNGGGTSKVLIQFMNRAWGNISQHSKGYHLGCLNPVYEPGVGKQALVESLKSIPGLNPVYEPGVGKRIEGNGTTGGVMS